MKHFKLKLAVLSTLGLVAAQAMATGLVAIPAAGFSGSAYTLCNTTGNFGSSTPTAPTTGANNTCAVFPTNEATSPVAGYTLIASTTKNAVIGGVTVGTVLDRVWRNSGATSCIYGTRFTASNVDYLPGTTGTQYFEVNDIARGGFSSSGSVNAGYFIQAANASPIYRIGRSFTSVQHRALKYDTAANKLLDGTNYLDLPTIGGSSTLNINGENTPIGPSTTATTVAANQTAAVNSNWINFTLDSGFQDDDGGTNVVSGVVYVEAACTSAAPVVATGAIRLRQTAQENANFAEIIVDGYAPPGAVVP